MLKEKPYFHTEQIPTPLNKFERAKEHFLNRDFDTAKKLFRDVLKKSPHDPVALYALGTIEVHKGHHLRGIKLLKKSLDIDEINASGWFNLGKAYEGLFDPSNAIKSYTKAISLDPEFLDAYRNRAAVYYNRYNLIEAINDCSVIFSKNPDDMGCLFIAACAKKDQYELADAKKYIDKFIELKKYDYTGYIIKSEIERELGNYQEAISAARTATNLEPDKSETFLYLGFAEQMAGNYESAIKNLDESIKLDKQAVLSYHNKGHICMSLGDFESGWELLEWRKKIPGYQHLYSFKPGNIEFDGTQSLDGKSIFVISEQGYGDCIHFSRYIRLLKEKGATVYFGVEPQLAELMTSLYGVDGLILPNQVIPKIDYYCHLMSLPYVFSTRVDTIPWNGQYLSPQESKSLYWQDRLENFQRLRIGLTWSSGQRPNMPELYTEYKSKSIDLKLFEPLKEIDADFFSLQKGEPAEGDLKEISKTWKGPVIHNFVDEFQNFADTAAFMANLDLVITACTSIAHLAGSMNIMTLLLLKEDACWRWMKNTNKTLWYPSMTLYRQTKKGNWQDVIDNVVSDLRSLKKTVKIVFN